MNRRDILLALLALGLAPTASNAQTPRRIVILNPFEPSSVASERLLQEFRVGLTRETLTEGRDYALDSVVVKVGDQLPDRVREAIGRDAALIVAVTTPVAQAAVRESRGQPVVFGVVSDPVGAGLVASLPHPGGNATGVSHIPEVVAKLLELVLDILPGTTRVGVLFNSDNAAKVLELGILRNAAKARGLMLQEFPVRSGLEIERALTNARTERAQALVILSESVVANNGQRIAEINLRMRLPIVTSAPGQGMGGVLASYYPSYAEQFQRLAAQAAKILQGRKPSEIPVEQPTKLEMVINMKTAKALGIKVPSVVLMRADRVIE